MGLDMYLSKKTYVKNWDYMKASERHTVAVSGPRAADIRPERISYIEEEVAYWRKANAIHQWFVDVCQNGVDECQQTYVSREQLTELATLCAELTALRKTSPSEAEKRAAEALPPQAGFFFGSTDLDEYYWEDVRKTAETLAALLAENDTGSFYYRSSW
jgi:leucyl aminopeptidase (aminopeptidase T)